MTVPDRHTWLDSNSGNNGFFTKKYWNPYALMNIDSDITYRLVDSVQVFHGRCTSLNGATLSFIADRPVATGKGLEIHLQTNDPASPCMVAFIETDKITALKQGKYEISSSIKIIKGK